MNLRNALSNAFVGSGGGFTGGSLTAAVSVPTAASASLANARLNGVMFGASPGAANEGISAFNFRLHFFSQGEYIIQAGALEFRFGSTTWLEWSPTSAGGGARTSISGGLADATLQLGKNHATTATNQTVKAHDVTTGDAADLILSGGTSGGGGSNGSVRFGTHAAVGIELVTGYITIKDEVGTLRKLAVIS
jgi:hypothetical protein